MTYVQTDTQELIALVPETSNIFRSNSIVAGAPGAPFTKDQYSARLASMISSLNAQMSNYPRMDGESLTEYIDRANAHVSMSGISKALGAAAVCRDNIARLEAEEAAEQERLRAEREADRQRARQALVWQSKPDPEEVNRLQKLIEAASKHERLLSDLYTALTAHDQAQNARNRLRDIFSKAQIACDQLRKPAPVCPEVPDAPTGAMELASRLVRRRHDGYVEA